MEIFNDMNIDIVYLWDIVSKKTNGKEIVDVFGGYENTRIIVK